MEITTFQTYLVMIVDNIKAMFVLITILALIWSFINLIIISENYTSYSEDKSITKKYKGYLKLSLSVMLGAILLNTIIPSTKQLIATIVIPKIVNNKDIQGISNDTIKAIGLLINEEIDNVKKRK